MEILKVKVNSENAIIPKYGRDGDAGLDLFTSEDVVIYPKETVIVPTGLSVQLPNNYEGNVKPRSGISVNGVAICSKLTVGKDATTVLKDPCQPYLRVIEGTIDCNYRGQIGIIVYNQEDYTVLVPKHTKLAQMIIREVKQVAIEQVDELDESNRGDNGFGSSGVGLPVWER